MELKQYAAIVWRWKWLVILATLLAGITAFVVSKVQVPVYEATTTLLINQAPNTNMNDYTSILTSERLAQTYAKMLTDRPVLEEVIKRLGLNTTAKDLNEAITVQLVANTQLITVDVENTSPGRAAEIGNTLVAVFDEQNTARQMTRYAASKENLQAELDRLQAQVLEAERAVARMGTPTTEQGLTTLASLQAELTQARQAYASTLQSYEALRIAEAQSLSTVTPVEPATPPEDPIRPRTMLNTLLAAIVGGMLAVGVVFLVEYLDDTVKTAEDVRRTLGLPVIGTIARMNESKDGGIRVAKEPRSPVAEAFRSLRTNIQFASVDRPLRTLLITSPGPQEGKTTISTNLAAVITQGGKRVILVDADLRRPRVHKVLGLPNRVGLVDLFVRTPLALDGALQATEVDGLQVILSGDPPANAVELLGTDRMDQILDLVASGADMVIVDAPPVAVVADAMVLSARVDGVILVLQPKLTRLEVASQAVSQLRVAGANVIGVVFNNVPLKQAGYYGGYGYQYAYEDKDKGKHGKQ